MSDQKSIEIEILRYRPEEDATPVFQSYMVPFTDDMSVLQGLQYVKDHLDSTVSYRWSCRMAICGSCGMMINGVPNLACHTFLREFYPGKIQVEPLNHFPIKRDLVVDSTNFIAKLESITPYIVPKAPRTIEDGEYLQTPEEMEAYHQFAGCINCMLCYAACPQFGIDDRFLGPGATALLHRYNNDSRDCGTDQRMELVNSEQGVWQCTAVGYCSEVCPKEVDPANAVNVNKVNSAKAFFLRFLSAKGNQKGHE